ncbi:MAG: FAD-binding oxidoreductase [Kangiellaceae bacterium]|nr:FAD-binding oxidoreductase [Kangiellaceae bacterium]
MRQEGSVNKYLCKTVNVHSLNEQIFRVRFQLADGSSLNFKGGQYIVLHMPDGKKVPLSIASAPEEKAFVELHIRLVEGHSLAQDMIDLFKTADSFHLEGPCGGCFLNDSNRDLIIIAGGTGFSPMKSLIESAFAQKNERQIKLYLGAQIIGDLYQHELIKQWQTEYDNFSYVPVISGDDSSWQGERGFPHVSAIQQNKNDLRAKDFYISGSEPMVVAVYNELISKDVDKSQIHSDILNIKRENGEIE